MSPPMRTKTGERWMHFYSHISREPNTQFCYSSLNTSPYRRMPKLRYSGRFRKHPERFKMNPTSECMDQKLSLGVG
ncbi:hypothetical protein ACTXT7_013867 [Hymenolepis weldensis]